MFISKALDLDLALEPEMRITGLINNGKVLFAIVWEPTDGMWYAYPDENYSQVTGMVSMRCNQEDYEILLRWVRAEGKPIPTEYTRTSFDPYDGFPY